MTLAFVALLTWRSAVRRSALTFCLLLGAGLATLLTFRRTAIASVVAAGLWLKVKMRSVGVLVAAAAAAPVALVVLFQPLVAVVEFTYNDYIVGGDTEARTVLTVDSFEIAAANFPGGAGFGRFGSAVAAATYSPEYIARGYQYIWGLGPGKGKGNFLTDTEWPAIIGETGFFGSAAFVLGLVTIWRVGRRSMVGSGFPRGPLDRAAGDGLDGERIDHLDRERGVHRSAVVRDVLRSRRGPHGVRRTAGSSRQSEEVSGSATMSP